MSKKLIQLLTVVLVVTAVFSVSRCGTTDTTTEILGTLE